jgi:hypothetical protein
MTTYQKFYGQAQTAVLLPFNANESPVGAAAEPWQARPPLATERWNERAMTEETLIRKISGIPPSPAFSTLWENVMVKLSRRSALAVVGSLPAVALPIPALACGGKPSALIEGLMRKYRAALAARTAAFEESRLAEEQYDRAEPPPPEALRPRAEDARLQINPPSGRPQTHYAAPCDLPHIDDCIRNTFNQTKAGNRTVVEFITEDWPERRARVEEIRTAYDRWTDGGRQEVGSVLRQGNTGRTRDLLG